MVERIFPDGLALNSDAAGAAACRNVVRNNAEEGVTWVHSYVSEDRSRTWCIYDGPSPEAIRRTAERNGLPIESISTVRVLDPYFHFVEAQ
jgi:predicted amidohydrolase YtcJ